MAKRSGAGSMAAGRKRGSGRRAAGGGQRTGAAIQLAGTGSERMLGAAGKRGGSRRRNQGVLASARDVAQSFGKTTAKTARQVASSARNAATSVAGRTQESVSLAVGKVRENPWPSLLIGAGATWLAVDAIRGHSKPEVRGKARRGEVDSGPGLVRRTASTIAGAGRGAGEYVGDFVRERPLLAGATTLGIGMAVGLAMPSTSSEDGVMGSVRDGVVRRAKDAAKGTMDAVRNVADGVERMASGGRERTR